MERERFAGFDATRLRQIVAWLAAGLITFGAISAWFDTRQFDVLAADGLRTFEIARGGFAALNGASIAIYKFRPVAVAALVAAAK